MRNLDDSDSFPAIVQGPTFGDSANGEENSAMGDGLMRRTRWAGNRLTGAWRVMGGIARSRSSTNDIITDLTGDTPGVATTVGTLTAPAAVLTGDLLVVESTIHVQIEAGSRPTVELRHEYDNGAVPDVQAGVIRIEAADVRLPFVIRSIIPVVAGMNGTTPTVVLRAMLVNASSLEIFVMAPRELSLYVLRENGTL